MLQHHTINQRLTDIERPSNRATDVKRTPDDERRRLRLRNVITLIPPLRMERPVRTRRIPRGEDVAKQSATVQLLLDTGPQILGAVGAVLSVAAADSGNSVETRGLKGVAEAHERLEFAVRGDVLVEDGVEVAG